MQCVVLYGIFARQQQSLAREPKVLGTANTGRRTTLQGFARLLVPFMAIDQIFMQSR